jgi:glycosyltransferase involved in cell wall biosynthesis
VVFPSNLFGFTGVGSHPQFRHLQHPPQGYRFVGVSGEPSGSEEHIQKAAVAFAREATRRGVPLDKVSEFLNSRDPGLQLYIPQDTRLAFLPTFPLTFGQVPWIVEIEDLTTLFWPYLRNGKTADVQVRGSDQYLLLKVLLESDSCRGIVTHVRSTAEGLVRFFDSQTIADKTTYSQMGLPLQPEAPAIETSERVKLLFTNSWHQEADSFYVRGGLDVLEAFAALHADGFAVELVLRTALPIDLPERYRAMLSRLPITVLDQKLEPEEMTRVVAGCDVYVLPAARLHVVSILQAMAYGRAVVASDGWGLDEYVEHERNALVINGRYGKVAWIDAEGFLREDYQPLRSADPTVTCGLTQALRRLVIDADLRTRLGATARKDVIERFTVDNWNAGLKRAFDWAQA